MKLVSILLIAVLASAASVDAQIIFQDGFENGFADGWYGRFDIFEVTDQNAHTGQHAVTTNGLWHWLAVDLVGYQTNTTFQCWFFDGGQDDEEHMIGVSVDDPCCGSQNILWIGLEAYFDPGRYMWGRGWEEISTTIPRSYGWHLAEFYTDGSITRLSIDGEPIAIDSFQAGWRYIVIWENSKFPEPHTMNYWDDVLVFIGETTSVPAAPSTTWGRLKTLAR